MRRTALALALAAAILLSPPAVARRTVAQNRATARTLARRLLDKAVLPPGARQVSRDPSVGSVLSGVNGPWSYELRALAYRRYWVVPGDPEAVDQWIATHPPAGAKLNSESSSESSTGRWVGSEGFGFVAVPSGIFQDGLQADVATARGGGAAIRVDGWAWWLLPRPVWEVVPAQARAVQLFADGYGRHDPAFGIGMVTRAAAVRRVIGLVDQLEVVQESGFRSCPILIPPLLELRFEPTLGGAPLARAVEAPCGVWSFSVRGRQGPELQPSQDFEGLLWRLGALAHCASGQLRVSGASVFDNHLTNPQLQLRFRNTSRAACALDGFPAIAPGVGTRDAGPASAVLLAPGDSAGVWVVWQRCGARRIGALHVRLPGDPQRFRIRVGSARRPFAPCGGRFTVDSVSPSL